MAENTWHGYKAEKCLFEARQAIIVFPEKADDNGNWLFKTEYWDAFPEIEIQLLKRGFHVAYVKNRTRFATKEDCDTKAKFVKYISDTYGLKNKCIPVGMSCGGAHAVNFAGYYPECIACMFIDAPVLNFCDFPGRIGDSMCESVWENEFVKAYEGMSRYKLLNFKNHPINMADKLIENKIPILMVYGTADDVVIYESNGALLEDAYKDTKDLLTVISVEGRGHHPHGIPDANERIVEYIIEHSR